ncbi:TrbI/VirB10 family protein [Rudaea sp.]|uniref:TrbI/VirB10 family protein n=1 Tax=Rudaea sp. TaxID=2136325 RepID=UPI0039E4532E
MAKPDLSPAAKREIAEIARVHLKIETLEERRLDCLDVHKRAFADARRADNPYLDQMVVTPNNRIYLGAGTLIPAVLLTGINSDLPGMITAQVVQTVYDTVTGERVLIPQGSTLIGEYDSRITYGQECQRLSMYVATSGAG